MARTTNWWDQNIGDWINDRIADFRDNNRDSEAQLAANKHFEARQNVLSGYELPPGYDLQVSRSNLWSRTDLLVRSPPSPEMMGEKKNEQESGLGQHQAAVNNVLSKNNIESTKDAAERMTQLENYDRDSQGLQQEQQTTRQQEPEQGQEKAKQQEQAHELER